MRLLIWIRARFHPLFRLRRSPLGAALLSGVDLPLPWRFRGVPFPIWLRSVRHASLVLLGARAEAALNDAFRSAATVGHLLRLWDVGANIGWYSWTFLSSMAQRHALLLEPDPDNLALLHRTVRRLVTRATILPLAASDHSGSARFATDPLTGATGSLVTHDTFLARHYGREGDSLEVATTRLDDLLGCFGAPDFIKIDVEGAEHLVFAGASALLRAQPVIIYETTSANRDRLTALLTGLGYRLFDAEGYGQHEQVSPNVLAWPTRLHHRTEELLKEWRSRQPP
jgi:FkbM family methyltransferase